MANLTFERKQLTNEEMQNLRDFFKTPITDRQCGSCIVSHNCGIVFAKVECAVTNTWRKK